MRVAPLLATASHATAAALSGRTTGACQADCSPLEVIIARGTTEPPAPTYGVIVGDPLFKAAKALIPELTGYAVNYPASLECSSKTTGAADTVSHIVAQSKACPEQQFALVGYSQGADVINIATQTIPADVAQRVIAVIGYGDPANRGPGNIDPLGGKTAPYPPAYTAKLKEICGDGDPVCTNDGVKIDAHLMYGTSGSYISDGAAYIQKQFKSGGKSGAEKGLDPGTQTQANSDALVELGKQLGGSGPLSC